MCSKLLTPLAAVIGLNSTARAAFLLFLPVQRHQNYIATRAWFESRSWGSSVTSAISSPLDFRNGPGVGLQAHSAVFAAVAIATIAAGVSTTEVEVQAIRATCAAFAVVASVTTGVSLDSRSAVFAGVAIIIATTGVSRDFQNGPGVGLQAHTAFSGVSIWAHHAVVVVVAVAVAAAAPAATTARACVACTAWHA